MANIRVPGWKTEITADSITFERADWFCVAKFCDVIERSAEFEKHGWKDPDYSFGSVGIIGDFIAGGAPIRRYSKTWRSMIEAIAEAVKASQE